jgi:DNA-binding MarR family transcriptional regulator
MQPNLEEVKQMVGALFSLVGSLKRAQKNNQPANLLALLQIIAARGQVRPSELAEELGVNQSSITRQIQGLEDEGDVIVSADPKDQRACIIRLTDPGQTKMHELTQIGIERFSKFVSDWDAEEVRMLTRLLLKLEQSKTKVAAREGSQIRAPSRWRHKEM